MTRFYWVDNDGEASNDAALKGYSDSEWIFCENKAALVKIDIDDYQGVYLRTGLRELEQEFARIMRRNSPSWLC